MEQPTDALSLALEDVTMNLAKRTDLVIKEEDISSTSIRSHESVGKFLGGGENITPPPRFHGPIPPIRTGLEDINTLVVNLRKDSKSAVHGMTIVVSAVHGMTIVVSKVDAWMRDARALEDVTMNLQGTDGPVLETITPKRKRLRSHEVVRKFLGGENITPSSHAAIAAIRTGLEDVNTRLANFRKDLERASREWTTTLSRIDAWIRNQFIFDKNLQSYEISDLENITTDLTILRQSLEREVLHVKDGFCPVPIAAMLPTLEQRRDDLEEILRAAAHGPWPVASLPLSFPAISSAKLEPSQIGYFCRFYNNTFGRVI
ncbi:hypothetical protein R1sor_003124 [Riccia sorocarpa]|uniref:Uncharacterized protein n=1 Tax=Riccia sorocarpa TaxID=122646 RepID=A0ABD3H3S1_9MARC